MVLRAKKAKISLKHAQFSEKVAEMRGYGRQSAHFLHFWQPFPPLFSTSLFPAPEQYVCPISPRSRKEIEVAAFTQFQFLPQFRNAVRKVSHRKVSRLYTCQDILQTFLAEVTYGLHPELATRKMRDGFLANEQITAGV